MAFLRDLMGIDDAQRDVALSPRDLTTSTALATIFGVGLETFSGESVNRDTAMGVPGIFAAVNRISFTIADLPLHYFRRTPEGMVKATEQKLYRILHDIIAPDSNRRTSFSWRKWLVQELLLEGRSYTLIIRDVAGRVKELVPLETTRVEPKRAGSSLVYYYTDAAGTRHSYAERDVLDFCYFPSFNGVDHVNPIHALRNSIGTMIAAERASANSLEGGGMPPLAIKFPPGAADSAEVGAKAMSEALRRAQRNKSRFFPIFNGWEVEKLGFDLSQQQMIETRQWLVEEACRIWNIPPTFIQSHEHSTFSNAEHLDLHYAKHVIQPITGLIEAELNAKLFENWDNEIKFNFNSLQRADFKTRTEGYARMIQIGVMTPDEVRSLEDWAELGGSAAELWVQGAMVPMEAAAKKAREPTPAPVLPTPNNQDPAEPGGDEDE